MANRASRRRSSVSAKETSQRRHKNSHWLIGLGGVVLVAIVAAVILSAGLGGSDTTSSGGTDGSKDAAPNFSFTLYQGEAELGGQKLDFDQLIGKPTVLNFWAGLCPPCRAEMPDLQAFHDEFKDRVTLIGIDIGPFVNLGSHRDARDLLKELDITYPAGFTDDSSVVRKYKVLGMPTSVFIDSRGKIFQQTAGALNLDILTRTTNEMLKEETPVGS